jgi:hypothetical protein
VQPIANRAPSGFKQASGTEFDTVFTTAIGQHLDITPAQSADARVWWLMNSLVFGDYLIWRWRSDSGITEDRYREIPANVGRCAFSRLWRRSRIFDPAYLAKFGGEAIDQILERPRLRDDHEIANLILENVGALIDRADLKGNEAQSAIVSLSKRLLRRFAVVNSISLTSKVKANLVRQETELMVEQIRAAEKAMETIE